MRRREDNQRRQNLSVNFVGKSEKLQRLIKRIQELGRCDFPILICGETGTGKELCARALHEWGPRADQPFVAINCANLSPDLVSNELYGHEREAFTGAANQTLGLVSKAQGGTLFLDEVDSLHPRCQGVLLRFLQEQEYRPVGANTFRRSNVRLVAATNASLSTARASGNFRNDLYFRLARVILEVPPLRERPEDIPPLAEHLLTKFCAELGKPKMSLTQKAATLLMTYTWHGNVRELESVLFNAALDSSSRGIHPDMFDGLMGNGVESEPLSYKAACKQFQKCYLHELMTRYSWEVDQAAEAAELHKRVLYRLLRTHGVRRPTMNHALN